METFKTITDWPRYEISNYGNVKNVMTGRMRKPSVRPRGYKNVALRSADGKHGHAYVHRLVANAFILNPLGLKDIDHIDGNPGNNNVENLRWCTHQANIRFAMDRRGGHWHAGKPNTSVMVAYNAVDAATGNKLSFKSLADACKHFGKSYTTFAPVVIRSIKMGWIAYGFIWSR
jgi:hypothetical protein